MTGLMIVSNSVFTGNTASDGGALFNYGGSFVLTDNTVSGNSHHKLLKLREDKLPFFLFF